MTWSRAFEDPIALPKGRQLLTLEEAAADIMKLPKAEHPDRKDTHWGKRKLKRDEKPGMGVQRTSPASWRLRTRGYFLNHNIGGNRRLTAGTSVRRLQLSLSWSRFFGAPGQSREQVAGRRRWALTASVQHPQSWGCFFGAKKNPPVREPWALLL
jgi:hypothetical protein